MKMLAMKFGSLSIISLACLMMRYAIGQAAPPMPIPQVPPQVGKPVIPAMIASPAIVPPVLNADVKTTVLSLREALHFALENNPTLATQRRMRGIAAAKVVIADTYPFNPVLENRIQGASGPQSAGITNKLPLEHLLLWEVEVRHQGQYRRQGAAAALSRTEFEIASFEQTLAVDVTRAYMGLVYRQEKLRLIEETLRVNERLVEDVRRLVSLAKLRPADLIVAQSEIADTLDTLGSGREALIAARQDLNKALGQLKSDFGTEGVLESPHRNWESAQSALYDLALNRRADLRAKQMAIAEAHAARQLAIANRHGNPIIGPVATYDSSRVASFGIQINIPLSIANKHRGEIQQSEAEHALAVQMLLQGEFVVKQDVSSALVKLAAAEPKAEQAAINLSKQNQFLQDMEKLFQASEPGVDILKVIDLRRKLLKARDSHLDAQWSVRQALIDVSAATGEPLLDVPVGEVPRLKP